MRLPTLTSLGPTRLHGSPAHLPRDVFRFVAEYCIGLENIDHSRSLSACLSRLLTLASSNPSLSVPDRQLLTNKTLELLDFLDSLREASLLYSVDNHPVTPLN
jgi:hypothetical protein